VTWTDDPLEFGYVLARLPDGGWWHLHFARGGASYPCQLLGRTTNVLGCLQRFAAGAVATSRRFTLTLDGEGVVLLDDAPLDFTWADIPASVAFQQSVVPELYANLAFQEAASEVIRHERHLRVVVAGRTTENAAHQSC
jgi:hypothetical protein